MYKCRSQISRCTAGYIRRTSSQHKFKSSSALLPSDLHTKGVQMLWAARCTADRRTSSLGTSPLAPLSLCNDSGQVQRTLEKEELTNVNKNGVGRSCDLTSHLNPFPSQGAGQKGIYRKFLSPIPYSFHILTFLVYYYFTRLVNVPVYFRRHTSLFVLDK